MNDSSPPAGLPYAAIATTLLLWGSAFVGIRHLAGAFSPGSLSLGRLAVGSAVLALGFVRRPWRAPTRDQWVRMVVVGLLWFGVYNVALNEGEHRVDAGTAALLIQLAPVLVALFSVLFLGQRLTRALVVGIAIAFAGVAVISVSTSPGGHRDLLGVGLCLLAALCYSVSLLLQKPVVGHLSAAQVTFVACTVGAVATLPWAGRLVGELHRASTGDVLTLVYLGVFPTAVAFTTYAFALKGMSAAQLGVTTYLVPPVTVLISWVLLGEVPGAWVWLGGALCLVGVSVARRQSGGRARRRDLRRDRRRARQEARETLRDEAR